MTRFLYWAVGLVARIHGYLMRLNNSYETSFTDKELHFLVIGLLGMGMIFVVYPLFKYLARKHREMVIAWIYVFTVLIGITFAIEIGQKITNTGHMEFADILYGIVGFLTMFFLFCILRGIWNLIKRLIRYWKKHRGKGKYST